MTTPIFRNVLCVAVVASLLSCCDDIFVSFFFIGIGLETAVYATLEQCVVTGISKSKVHGIQKEFI
jgi:hypothetical protein